MLYKSFFLRVLVVASVCMFSATAQSQEKVKHEVPANAAPKDFSKPAKAFVNLPADLEKTLLETANKQFKFQVDKIYFLEDDWVIGREPSYPNRVTMRTRFGYCLTNQDGKWIRTIWTLQQRSDLKGGWTNTYLFVAGNPNDYNPAPVINYDPKLVKIDYKP